MRLRRILRFSPSLLENAARLHRVACEYRDFLSLFHRIEDDNTTVGSDAVDEWFIGFEQNERICLY